MNPGAGRADPVDLTNCDREPIHVPGAIQPHGVLFALRPADLRVAQVSANASEHVGLAPRELLGRGLESVLDAQSLACVRTTLESADPRAASPIRLTTLPGLGARPFAGILHRSGPVAILELEPSFDTAEVSFADFYRRVRGAVARLQRGARAVEMCQLAVAEVALLTGFDRVMAYRFDADGHGHVIAEEKRDDLESYLDLHYPASDIPAQARRLYTLNWLRLIVDVAYRPSPLIADADDEAPLDLSFAVLRSVSPIHVEYLQNMGVHASMSVSLVVDGQLWGMLICHHGAPRFVPYEVRSACEFLGQALSWQVAARERGDAFERRASSQHTLAQVVDQLARESDLSRALAADATSLLGLVDATGAAIRIDGTWTRLGPTPKAADLDALAGPLEAHMVDGLFATDSLVRILPEARDYDAVASGALAVALAAERGDLVVWFRPEVVQTVNWAGDPHKLASLADGDARLTPRGSFALWRETLRSRALPWQPSEVEAAAGLQHAAIGRVLRRNAELEARIEERTAALTAARDELARYADDLTISNVELERFAYIASHDLQEPLRMVVSYVQLLARRYKGRLDSDADEFIAFAVDGAKRMQALINDLLTYSRVGRQERPMVDVDLEAVYASALDNLAVAVAESGAQVTRDPLPHVLGNASQLGQLMQNLIGNALKFHGVSPPHVHVGATRTAGGGDWTVSVRDDGIGIAPEHLERIFVMFQRLHTRAEYPGSGVGLAISKKIVERHGGRIWVESVPGQGTTFFFTLPESKLEVPS